MKLNAQECKNDVQTCSSLRRLRSQELSQPPSCMPFYRRCASWWRHQSSPDLPPWLQNCALLSLFWPHSARHQCSMPFLVVFSDWCFIISGAEIIVRSKSLLKYWMLTLLVVAHVGACTCKRARGSPSRTRTLLTEQKSEFIVLHYHNRLPHSAHTCPRMLQQSCRANWTRCRGSFRQSLRIWNDLSLIIFFKAMKRGN